MHPAYLPPAHDPRFLQGGNQACVPSERKLLVSLPASIQSSTDFPFDLGRGHSEPVRTVFQESTNVAPDRGHGYRHSISDYLNSSCFPSDPQIFYPNQAVGRIPAPRLSTLCDKDNLLLDDLKRRPPSAGQVPDFRPSRIPPVLMQRVARARHGLPSSIVTSHKSITADDFFLPYQNSRPLLSLAHGDTQSSLVPRSRMDSQVNHLVVNDDTRRGNMPNTTSLSVPDLQREATLLSGHSSPRSSKELSRLLVGGRRSNIAPLSSSSDGHDSIHSGDSSTQATSPMSSHFRHYVQPTLEQTRSKPRVSLDLILYSDVLIEGGTLKGRLDIWIDRKVAANIMLGCLKVRVVGFEELPAFKTRSLFYHHCSEVDTDLPFVTSSPDSEGFCCVKAGAFQTPFKVDLPFDQGAKGSWKAKRGEVRYIAIGSIKLKNSDGSDPAITHFYREVDVLPYFNPNVTLAPSNEPVTSTVAKPLFMGGKGNVELTAILRRFTWVAGQKCYIEVRIVNNSTKKLKTLTISLARITTVCTPNISGQDEAMETEEFVKKVAETTFETGKKGLKGNVTAKGNWIGVEKGESRDFLHSILLPADAFTLPMGRYFGVRYALRVVVAGGPMTTDVTTIIPIRIVNFASLYPPLAHSTESTLVPQSKQFNTEKKGSIVQHHQHHHSVHVPSFGAAKIPIYHSRSHSVDVLPPVHEYPSMDDERFTRQQTRNTHQTSLDVIDASMNGPFPRSYADITQDKTGKPLGRHDDDKSVYEAEQELDMVLEISPDFESDEEEEDITFTTPDKYDVQMSPGSPTNMRRRFSNLADALADILSDDGAPEKEVFDSTMTRPKSPSSIDSYSEIQHQRVASTSSCYSTASLTRSKAIGRKIRPSRSCSTIGAVVEDRFHIPGSTSSDWMIQDGQTTRSSFIDGSPFDLERSLSSCKDSEEETTPRISQSSEHNSMDESVATGSSPVQNIMLKHEVHQQSDSPKRPIAPISMSVKMRIAALEEAQKKSENTGPDLHRISSLRSSASTSSIRSYSTSATFNLERMIGRATDIKTFHAPILQ